MNVQEVSLDISLRRGISPEVYLGQDDSNATTLVASVFDGAAPFDLTGYTVRFCMRLPDGIHYYSVAGTTSGNVATFDIDETYAGAVHGTTDVAYVEISDGDDLVASTSRMCVIVLRGAQAGATPGEAYISEIEEVVERLDEVVEEAEEVIEHGIPLMSTSARGGAMVGNGLAMNGEVLSVDSSALVTQAEKGAANGVASLDSSGFVPSGQLPSYVDDVIEGYYYNGAFYEESTHQTLITGETGKIYVDLTADSSYRWSGSAYISISNPIDIATEAEARAGNDNTKMMTPLRVKQVVTGDIAPNSVTSSGEVTATETSGGTTSLHKLTEKADMAVVESRSKCWYGQCDTGASVAAKVVTCSGFELVKGAMIAVHFTYSNTATLATLNVNSTGAKEIATGNTVSGQDNFWYAGEIMMFTYDGTYWRPANMAGINALRESVSKIAFTEAAQFEIGFYQSGENAYIEFFVYGNDGTLLGLDFNPTRTSNKFRCFRRLPGGSNEWFNIGG